MWCAHPCKQIVDRHLHISAQANYLFASNSAHALSAVHHSELQQALPEGRHTVVLERGQVNAAALAAAHAAAGATGGQLQLSLDAEGRWGYPKVGVHIACDQRILQSPGTKQGHTKHWAPGAADGRWFGSFGAAGLQLGHCTSAIADAALSNRGTCLPCRT